jgi:hypothetical protein
MRAQESLSQFVGQSAKSARHSVFFSVWRIRKSVGMPEHITGSSRPNVLTAMAEGG